MRTRAQWYKAKAEQCSERAKAAPDPETKRIYEHMAQEWVDLASARSRRVMAHSVVSAPGSRF
jgi:hypothetical protein